MTKIQRNIEVDLEVWTKLKAEAIDRNKNLREYVGEILADYIKGKKVGKPKRTKTIIIGAGSGTRLMPLTKDRPKCMLKIKGKTILQRQIDVLNKCGITDIIFVKGYKKEAINYPELKYYYNTNYKNNNILESLFCAEREMNREFIVTYSDILFENRVVEKLLESKKDISLVVDTNWRSHYNERYQHPIEEAEKVIVKDNKIVKIGKCLNPINAYGEFIGMAKFSEFGAEILRTNYELTKKIYRDKPFHEAISVEKAYLTDMIQELIDRGYDVYNVDVEDGWTEIDTMEDYQRAGGRVD